MGGDCHGHDARRGEGEQPWWPAAEVEAEAESEAEIESQVEIEIEGQGRRWVKTWWIERWRKGG